MQNNSMPGRSMPQSAPMSTDMRSSLSTTDRQFVVKAAQSDMTEIKTSQLALNRSQNSQVRQFAQEMIQQHNESSSKLKPLAARKGVALPKDLGAENQALLVKLTTLSGTRFDQAYMDGQAKAHSKRDRSIRMSCKEGEMETSRRLLGKFCRS